MKIRKVKIADIVIPDRKRETDDDKVEGLATSIDDCGLLCAIILRSGNILVEGLHRLEACILLDWKEIDAVMLEDLTDLEAEKVEIVANFARFELNKLEVAQQSLRLREIWEEEHGPVLRGGDRRSKDFKVIKSELENFIKSLAKLLGVVPKVLYAIIKVARDLDPKVQETITGLPICDKRGELKRLAALPVKEQRKVAKGLKDGTITKVPVVEPPTVDEEAPPEPPEDPKPPRTPRTPSKPKDDDPAAWNRKVKDAIKEIKTTIKQQTNTLNDHGDYFRESTESLIEHFTTQLIDQFNSLRI
jgi:ParB family chromosome partitioning protein